MGHANQKVVAELGKFEKTGVNLKSTRDEVACAECVKAKLPALLFWRVPCPAEKGTMCTLVSYRAQG
jgi:glutamate-1-semialdehyde aminotransferase